MKYKKVFQLKLLNKLFLKKDFVYNIDINNTKLVNENTYSLLQMHMKKQQKQIKYLLKCKFIYSFFSSWNFSVIFIKKCESVW